MKLDKEYNSLQMVPQELSALSQGMGGAPNALSVIAHEPLPQDQVQAALSGLNAFDADKRQEFTSAIKDLLNPVQMAAFHYSIAEDSFNRSFLAWGVGDAKSLALLTQKPASVSVGRRSATEIKLLITRVLAVDPSLKHANILIKMTSLAAVVLIAIFDYYRLARYRSLLLHTVPADTFVLSEILDLMQQASKEDFRWPLFFLEKVLPADLSKSADLQKLSIVMDELIKTGFVEKIEAEQNEPGPAVYALTDAAQIVSEALIHNSSKVALTISAPRPDKQIGHETYLFLRDTNFLFLFDITGSQGVLTGLDAGSCDTLLNKIFSAPRCSMQDMPQAGVSPAATKQAGALYCAGCGAVFKPDAKFCPSCGTQAEAQAAPTSNKFCPGCGQPVNIDAKFCNGCGTAL
jgi:RNA polymerase subunit RPABC4/transcription elongation factor Spt4